MARFIDADKINYHEHAECMGHGDFETVRTVTDKEIAEMPTVDAVEVVRCKDCIRYKNDVSCLKNSRGSCEFDNERKSRNHFCSYGERIDNV